MENKIYDTEFRYFFFVYNNYKGKDVLSISELSKIEMISTIYRIYREREITQMTLDLLVEKCEADCEERYEILYFSTLVFDESWRLIRQLSNKYGLKTLDSLQFAFFKTYCDKSTFFACADLTFEKLIKREDFKTYLPLFRTFNQDRCLIPD